MAGTRGAEQPERLLVGPRDQGVDHVHSLEQVPVFGRHHETLSQRHGDVAEGPEPLDVPGREIGDHESWLPPRHLQGCLVNLGLLGRLAVGEVGALHDQDLGTQGRQLASERLGALLGVAVEAKVAGIADPADRCVNREAARAWDRVVHPEEAEAERGQVGQLDGGGGAGPDGGRSDP